MRAGGITVGAAIQYPRSQMRDGKFSTAATTTKPYGVRYRFTGDRENVLKLFPVSARPN